MFNILSTSKVALKLIAILAEQSIPFSLEPYPDDQYQVTVKSEYKKRVTVLNEQLVNQENFDLSSREVVIDGIAIEVAKIFIGVHKLNTFNVSQRGIRNVIKIAKNNPDVKLKAVLESLHDQLDK